MSIGVRIKNRRKELGLTLEEIGKIAGVSKATIQRYESGEITNIPSDRIEMIAKALNVSPAYLMGWEDKDEQTKLSTLEKDFPEGVSVLYRANEKLTEKEKQQMLKMINSVFFEDGEPEGDDLSDM